MPVGETRLIQELNSDRTCATPELFTRPSLSPTLESESTPPELPTVLADLQHAGHHFQTVSSELWKVSGPKVRIKKDCSVCFSVDTVVTSQDIVVGFDKSGIDIDSITSIQRKASNNTWIVTFDSPVSKAAALNEQSVTISGCVVFLGDCENKVTIFKLYELPTELPDSVITGRLLHYGRVFSFRRDRIAEGIYNGVRTARMVLDRPIPGQTFIAGEFARIWYPGQPKTCRKCGAEGHLAASCKSQRCFNCEQPGHRSDDCPLSPLCRVCLADSHPTPQCPYIYYSSNVLSVKVSASSYLQVISSYLQAAERGKQAEEIKRQQAEEERAEREKNEERERKERERERKDKERAEREREERKKQERKEKERKEKERKEKEKEDRRERERRDHECQEKQDRRERDRKDRHHRRREDQADSGDERRKESKEDRRRDREYDRSGRNRSSHRYSHASSSESEGDGDRGWIKVTHRKKSRSY